MDLAVKLLSVGMWVDCCRLWSVVCRRAPKFGSGISLSGKLVSEFNYFKKFQVFKFLSPVGSCQKVTEILHLAGRNFKMAGWLRTAHCVWTKKFFENGGTLPIDQFLGYSFGVWTRVKALPNVRPLISLKRSLPEMGWGILNFSLSGKNSFCLWNTSHSYAVIHKIRRTKKNYT